MVLRTNWLTRLGKRIGITVVSHTAKQIEEYLFDYPLYFAVIAAFGTFLGGFLMISLSASVCYIYLLLYDRFKKDFFSFELLKELRDGEGKVGLTARLVKWAAQKSDWLVFLVLSCFSDPFMTVVYMRKGVGKYNGLSPRDMKIFWGSVVVGNVGWTAIVSTTVNGFRFILHLFGSN